LHTVWRSEDTGDSRLVHLESGQAFWMEFGRYRDLWGVPSVEVKNETQRHDIAVLAALTVIQTDPIDTTRLRREVE
jgi:hypothetical protein